MLRKFVSALSKDLVAPFILLAVIAMAVVASPNPATAGILVPCTTTHSCDGDYLYDSDADFYDATFSILSDSVVDWTFINGTPYSAAFSTFFAFEDDATSDLWLEATFTLLSGISIGVHATSAHGKGNWDCHGNCPSGPSGIPITGTYVVSSTTIPEPTTLAIFGVGLAGLGFMRRRRKTAHA